MLKHRLAYNLNLSWQLNLRKSSQATSYVSSGNDHSPDDGDREGLQKVGLLLRTDMACCPRGFYRRLVVIILRKLMKGFILPTEYSFTYHGYN
jgi:hypothetical protein